ncbi:SDR family NAD(P)-dependent oxidoreductase [Streptomyces olivaceus]|uniref:SDR family NAD(P)-dependent oxidoreductase n=1 Tax=Streptomyces olivaceus TaxID=47716 RepID=UPI001CCBDF17|nr:SDR family NAD(P)-dependent oxidoreductase [Streptomyces olivaceus]MBZ6209785.1 SDR family NAD(P)-dependent oxidoreductase [Streptomyces olivaceus]
MDGMNGTRQSVLVTGAGSGIGRATTRFLAAEGFHVYAGARRRAGLDELAAELPPGSITPLLFDVRDEKSVARASAETADRAAGAPLRAVCNVAGTVTNGPLVDLTADALTDVLAVNVVGTHTVTRAFLPLLGEGSRIVNLSSASGVRTLPFTGAYSASKFGLEALSAAMRMEYAALGIRVSVIAPGMIDTPMAAAIQDDLGRTPSMPVYEAPLGRARQRSARSARNGIPMDRVIHAVHRVVTARNPAPRYDLHHSYLQDAVLMRLLPVRLREAVVRRALGLNPGDRPG